MISPEFTGQILISAVSLAFGAGGAHFLIKQSRKDVNGLGRKVNKEISRSSTRHQNLTVALMLLAPEAQREKIADLLKENHEESES
jgi:c-di-AMP phosphodiesterase-like protein